MAISLLGFIGLGDPSEKLKFILYMYFLHNCFASLQDVCTYALAIDILPAHEQGKMNGLMWGSKLVGKGVGAWGLSHVLNYGGLEACVAVQIVILLLIMLIPMFVIERRGEKRFPWSKGAASKKSGAKNPAELFRAFGRAFLLPTTAVYVFFTLAKLIGVGINEVVQKTLYTQHLVPKWTDIELTRVSGLYTTPCVIVAAIAGGFLADRFGRRKILIIGFGGYGLAAIVFAMNPALWNERWFATTYLISCETLNAVASVGFLSMAMRISWSKAAATVFTVYMTLSNVSHVVGNWIAGPVREAFVMEMHGDQALLMSYRYTFFLVGILSIVPLLLLGWVRPREVDKAKKAEKD